MLLLLPALAEAACPASSAELDASVVAVERAYAAHDAAGVAAAGEALTVTIACLDRAVDPARAARLHAAEGLVAFVAGDTERAAAAFGAARRVDPAWSPDPALVPKGHPIHALTAPPDTRPVPAPDRGALLFDGVEGQRPASTSTVAQWVVDGEVVSGAYTWPDGALPPYDVRSQASEPTVHRRAPVGWIATAAGSTLASAACFYLADRTRDAWESADTGAEVEARYTENHVLYGLGAGFGVVAGVGAVGAVVAVAF